MRTAVWTGDTRDTRPTADGGLTEIPHCTSLNFEQPWTIHDLRQTARSLLSRAGVSSEIAERVLGHAIPGIEGVYNRHAYTKEKAEALAKLAAVIEQIINPPEQTNVVPLRAS